MLNNTLITADILILSGLAVWTLVILLVKSRYLSLSKKQIILSACLTTLSIALTLRINSSNLSGTGTSTKFGWPHFYYQTWKSFEDGAKVSELSISYLMLNLFLLSGVLVLLLSSIIKLQKSLRPGK